MPRNAALLLYAAVVLLSTYTVIALVAKVDGRAVRQRLSGVVWERLCGGVLAGFGVVFFLRAAVVLAGVLTGKTPMAATELALNSTDFLFVPVWVASGVLLWRRKGLSYVTGLGVLFQASMLFVGLIIVLLVQPWLVGEPFNVFDTAAVFVMGLPCFVPLALFARGVLSTG
jgi:hypothetical protein